MNNLLRSKYRSLQIDTYCISCLVGWFSLWRTVKASTVVGHLPTATSRRQNFSPHSRVFFGGGWPPQQLGRQISTGLSKRATWQRSESDQISKLQPCSTKMSGNPTLMVNILRLRHNKTWYTKKLYQHMNIVIYCKLPEDRCFFQIHFGPRHGSRVPGDIWPLATLP